MRRNIVSIMSYLVVLLGALTFAVALGGCDRSTSTSNSMERSDSKAESGAKVVVYPSREGRKNSKLVRRKVCVVTDKIGAVKPHNARKSRC